MKMSPRQLAVFNEIANDGTVKLFVSGYGKLGERVLTAITDNGYGRKVNLQVDWLLARQVIALGPVPVSPHEGQEIGLTERGEKLHAFLAV